MDIIKSLIEELEREAVITDKMLERIPEDKFDWKPHTKSMDIKNLATHIAEIPSWIKMIIETSELDFATSDYIPTPINTVGELIKLHQESVEKSKEALKNMDLAEFDKMWTMRNGEHIIDVSDKWESIRHPYSQTSHHRAQLGVYLRLLDVPIPGSYGPSADDSANFNL